MEDNKYQQGKIYKIVCNITGEVYYGSTTEKYLSSRLAKHKSQECLSKKILDRCNYEMILIKNYPCNSKYELEEEEKKYIKENECINYKIPHRTTKEYYEDNKEERKEYRRNRYKNNKEEIKKKQQEKILCDCGEMVMRSNIARHKKSMKHIKLTECLIID